MSEKDISALLERYFLKDTHANLSELFKEKTEEYGLTLNQARELLGMEYKTLMPILNGTAKQPNLFNVLKVAEFLEIDLKELVTSLLVNQSPANIAKLEEAKRASFVAKNFDVDRLYSEGFIESKKDSNHIIERVLSFFGFDSIPEYLEFRSRVTNAVFSKTKRNFVDRMRQFSVDAAYRLFEEIDNPNKYDRDALIELVPKIKPYSRDVKNGLYTVCRALFSHGVTVIFQKHLTTSQYRGATFFIKNKPCIVITDLRKNYSTLWFALLHELHHVLFDEEEVKSFGYHLTGEVQLSLIDEDAADEFASDFFVDSAELKYISPYIHSKALVQKFAKKIKVHECIIYSKFQYHMKYNEGKDYYAAFSDAFPDYRDAVSRLNPISWKEGYSIASMAKSVKEIFDLKLEYERSEK